MKLVVLPLKPPDDVGLALQEMRAISKEVVWLVNNRREWFPCLPETCCMTRAKLLLLPVPQFLLLSGWKHSGTGVTEFVQLLPCLSLRLLCATLACIMLLCLHSLGSCNTELLLALVSCSPVRRGSRKVSRRSITTGTSQEENCESGRRVYRPVLM